MKQKTIYALFLISMVAIFAYMVMANFDTIVVDSPVPNNNYSGNLLLNVTLDGSPTDNATNVTFYFYNSTDGSLVYNLTFENSTSNQSLFNYTIDTTTVLADETYNITVNASNESDKSLITESTTTLVQIDNTAPLVTINTANNSFLGNVTTTLVFNATIIDSGVGIDIVNLSNSSVGGAYTYAQKSNDYYNLTIDVANLTLGENILTVWVNDTLGNLNNSETIIVWLDNVAGSTVNLDNAQYLQNYTWTTDLTPALYMNFSDDYSPNASCELFVDETGYGVNSVLNNTATALTANASLSVGVHSWYVNCTDLGGFVNSSLETSSAFELDVVSPINISTPLNNSWTSETRLGNVSFTFNFLSGLTNGNNTNDNSLVSCELFIENETGNVFNPAGVNTTALNNTAMTFTNNQTLVNGQATNWTINCSFNGSDITQAYNNDYWILNVDNSSPSVTVSSSSVGETTATLAATTGSEITTCRYSTSNVGFSSMSEMGQPGTTSHTTSLVSLSSGTGYTYYVKCQDRALNTVSSSTTFTTTSTSSGGGSGGSGGGVSTSAAGSFAKEVWASLNAGDTATVKVENGEMGLSEISFKADTTTYGVWVEAEIVSSLPTNMAVYTGKVYKNVQITGGNTEKLVTEKSKATVKFTVKKTWLTENKVDKTNMILLRYVNDKWVELTTTMDSDDGTYIHYTALTPGFSYFAIGEKAGAAPATAEKTTEAATEAAKTAESTTTTSPATTTNVATKKTTNTGWIIAVIVALIVIVAVVFFWKKNQK